MHHWRGVDVAFDQTKDAVFFLWYMSGVCPLGCKGREKQAAPHALAKWVTADSVALPFEDWVNVKSRMSSIEKWARVSQL